MAYSPTDHFEHLTREQVALMAEKSANRLIFAYALNGAQLADTISYCRQQWPRDPFLQSVTSEKAAVTPTAFALMPASLQSVIIERIRTASVVGRIAHLSVPFNVPFNVDVSSATFAWRGKGLVKPATRATFSLTAGLEPYALSGIAAFSREVERLVTSGQGSIVNAVATSFGENLDADFVDPAQAGIAGQQPASITNGKPTSASSGAFPLDFQTVLASYLANDGHPEALLLLMSSQDLAMAAVEFPTLFSQVTLTSAMAGAVPVLASRSIGPRLVAVDTSKLAIASGEPEISVSTQAAVQMDDAPTQSGAMGTGSSVLSFWQTNLLGVRLEQSMNWSALGAVTVISNVAYATTGSPA